MHKVFTEKMMHVKTVWNVVKCMDFTVLLWLEYQNNEQGDFAKHWEIAESGDHSLWVYDYEQPLHAVMCCIANIIRLTIAALKIRTLRNWTHLLSGRRSRSAKNTRNVKNMILLNYNGSKCKNRWKACPTEKSIWRTQPCSLNVVSGQMEQTQRWS